MTLLRGDLVSLLAVYKKEWRVRQKHVSFHAMSGMKKPEPIVYPYVTIEEMRAAPRLIENLPQKGSGTRYEGSTHARLALRLLQQLPTKNIAILECGPVWGQFTKLLQDRGYTNLHALDWVDMLHFPDKSKVSFHEINFNMETIPYPDQHFDFATAWGIAEHMENPFHFVREVYRVMKPGGTFLFSLPNVSHISSRIDFLFKGVFPRWNVKSNHIAILPSGIIEKTLYRYFEPVKVVYTKSGVMVTRKPKSSIRKYMEKLFDKVAVRIFKNSPLFGNYVCYVLKRRENVLPPVTHWPL